MLNGERALMRLWGLCLTLCVLGISSCCGYESGNHYECTCTVPSDKSCVDPRATYTYGTGCTTVELPSAYEASSAQCTATCGAPPDMDMSMDLGTGTADMSLPSDMGGRPDMRMFIDYNIRCACTCIRQETCLERRTGCR